MAWVKKQNAIDHEAIHRQRGIRPGPATAFSRCSTPTRAFPTCDRMGDYLYNFWRDKDASARPLAPHHAGRVPQDRSARGRSLLDVDALGKAEGQQVGLQGRALPEARLPPLPVVAVARRRRRRARCASSTSPARSFVKDGFDLPVAKSRGRLDRSRHDLRRHRLRPRLDDRLELPAHRQGVEARHAAVEPPPPSTKASRPTWPSAPRMTTRPGFERDFVSASPRTSSTASSTSATAAS